MRPLRQQVPSACHAAKLAARADEFFVVQGDPSNSKRTGKQAPVCYVNGVYENVGGGGKGKDLLQNPSGMIKFFLDHSLNLQAL